jgi:hypothetical protein
MPRRIVDLRGDAKPLLDIASYGRNPWLPLTPSRRVQIALTVHRAPEVMVKVSGGARSLGGVEAHFAYIGRHGELGVETDEGFRLAGKDFQKHFVPDWDLDLQAHRMQDGRSIRGTRRPPKLVHNVIFSMPPGTAPAKVLQAVRKFAANEFALKHRYAMVLHTDEAYPHVHLVVNVVSEQGERLNIRKQTLRDWRRKFAENLRELGVAANATERAVRGQVRSGKRDGIYRLMLRKQSTRAHNETTASARREVASKDGDHKLSETRAAIEAGWNAVAHRLHQEGDRRLAGAIRLFVSHMASLRTDQQPLVDRYNAQQRSRAGDS